MAFDIFSINVDHIIMAYVDPFSILIAGIISSIKLNKKAVELKNKNDTQFTQGVLNRTNQSVGQGMGSIANKYYKDDLMKYMNFLNKS